MASEKPTMILLSKSDMTKEEISILSDGEAWQIIYSLTAKIKDDRLQVCFTGFGVSKKQELTTLANKKNFKVVSSVTKKLDFLCGGENAGLKKIEQAESQGARLLNEVQFNWLLETGEIPDNLKVFSCL